MTGLVFYLMVALCTMVGAFLGALILALCVESKRRMDESLKERYSLTPQGRDALAEDFTEGYRDAPEKPNAPEKPDTFDAMETKARTARKDRQQQIRIENPQAFQPVLTNPNDPTDVVL